MNAKLQAHIALIVVNLIYGANYIIAKEVTPAYIKPFGFIVIRASMALLMYAILHRFLTSIYPKNHLIHKPIERKDYLLLTACGLFGVAINQLLFFKGLSLTSPINASLIMITAPILVLIFAAILIKEKITIYKVFGIILGTLGAGYIIKSSYSSGAVGTNWLGDLFIFINAASYSLYLVIVKPLMQRYHPFTIIKWVFFFGWLFVMPVGFGEFAAIEWHTFHTLIWACLAYVIIGTTFLTYLLNIFALQKVDASVVSTYIYTQPVIATTIAILLGKDTLSSEKIVSAVLIFIGVFLVSQTFTKKEQKIN